MGHERKNSRTTTSNPYKTANPYAFVDSYRVGNRQQRPRQNYRYPTPPHQKHGESTQQQQRRNRGRPSRQVQRASPDLNRSARSPQPKSSHFSRNCSDSTPPPGPPEESPPFEPRPPSQPRSRDESGTRLKHQNGKQAPQLDHEEILRVVKQVQQYSASLVEQLVYKDSEIENLKKLVKDSGADYQSELQAQVCKLQATLAGKQNESLKLHQDNAELVSSNKNLVEANNLLTDDLTERDREIVGVKNSVEELGQSLKFEKEASEGLNCTIARLREQVSMLQTEARELVNDKLAKLEQSFTADERERELRRTYDKVEYQHNVIREHYERNQELEVENMKAREAMMQMEREKAKTKKENEILKRENNILRKQIAKLQGKLVDRSKTLSTPPPPPFSPLRQKREKAPWKDGDSELQNFLENDPMSAS